MTTALATSDEIVVLADISSSMFTRDIGEGGSRIDALKKALKQLPSNIRVIAFNDDVYQLNSANELPTPAGTTDLALAIRTAAMHSPVKTLIVCDGEPNDEDAARDAAGDLTGIIDVIYCGSPSNRHAREYLASLAGVGMGKFYSTGDQLDVAKQLPAVIKGLLGS